MSAGCPRPPAASPRQPLRSSFLHPVCRGFLALGALPACSSHGHCVPLLDLKPLAAGLALPLPLLLLLRRLHLQSSTQVAAGGGRRSRQAVDRRAATDMWVAGRVCQVAPWRPAIQYTAAACCGRGARCCSDARWTKAGEQPRGPLQRFRSHAHIHGSGIRHACRRSKPLLRPIREER